MNCKCNPVYRVSFLNEILQFDCDDEINPFPASSVVRAVVSLQLTVSQSVCPSVLALSPSGTHDQILTVVRTVAVLFVDKVYL
jgi:hypothetical protein